MNATNSLHILEKNQVHLSLLILNVVFFLHVYIFFNGYERLVSSITKICLNKSNPKFAPNIKKRRNLWLALCYKVGYLNYKTIYVSGVY